MKATKVYVNGVIHTLATERPLEFLAISGNRILAAGRGSGKKYSGRHTSVIDLRGKAITPGLIDSHLHFLDYAWSLDRIDLEGCASETEVRSTLKDHASGRNREDWILGRGWKKEQFGGFPHRRILDEIFPDQPVALNSRDGHFVWINSRAMDAAGIREAPDISGGWVGRDSDRTLSGVLGENAVSLVTPYIKKPDEVSRTNSLLHAQQKLHSLGIVGLHSTDGNEAFGDLQALHRESRLKLRIFHSIPLACLEDAVRVSLRTGFGDDWLRFGFVKIFSDGTLGSQSAWMLQPFEGSSNSGLETISETELTEKIRLALSNGIAAGVHAIGDRANRQVLNAFEKNADLLGVPAALSRIEHAQILDPADIPRFHQIGVVASMQPHHAISDCDVAERYLGNRAVSSYTWRSLLENRTLVIFGSDAPIENPDPLEGMQAAVHRWNWELKEETIPPYETLLAYTKNPAIASGEAHRRGTLERGKLADFVVFSDDPLKTGYRDVRVVGTVIDGDFVYRDFE